MYDISLTIMSQERRFIPEEAAHYLGITPACLQKWRQRKQGPSYLKLGSRVYYDIRELNDFLINCKVNIPHASTIKEQSHGNTYNSNS